MLGNFFILLLNLKMIFLKILSGHTLSECQGVWIQDEDRHYVGPDLGPNCLEKLSAEDKILASKERGTIVWTLHSFCLKTQL